MQLIEKATFLAFAVEIVCKKESQNGLEGLPRQWVVERT